MNGDSNYSSENTKKIYSVFYCSNQKSLPLSLEKITILGGNLGERAFQNCESIQEVSLSFVPEIIPYECFYGCKNLQRITFDYLSSQNGLGQFVLPEGLKSIDYRAFYDCDSITSITFPEGFQSIEQEAFYSCDSITSVTIPSSLTNIGVRAFVGSALEQFSVAEGNTSYSSDRWGVLYNFDQTSLIQYPSGRKWPYYNVPSTVTTIQSSTFYGCNKLINLYIPNSVSRLDSGAIYNCPNTTICCFMNSAAYQYASNNNLTAWYMDN